MEKEKKVNGLNYAASQLAEAFQQSGDTSQIENAVQLWKQAVELIPNGHAKKPALLSNLGSAYESRFGHLGDLSDIGNAIVAIKQAIELTPDGHADKPAQLSNLGGTYLSQFGHLGELSDIENAIVALRQAVELTADGHAKRPTRLSNLGSAYRSRFSHLGDLSDIESGIVALKQAVELSPDGHAKKPSLLNNLGNAYQSRFSHLGDIGDIESAIGALKQAVELTPDGHAKKPPRDIDNAIVTLKQAVELTPDGHVNKSSLLNNLGNAHQSRFVHLGELSDIESAIVALKEAIDLTPDGHVDKAPRLSNLGCAYQSRFGHLGEFSDKESAIVALKQAVELTPDSHPDKPSQLSNLGTAYYQSQFGHRGELSEIESGIVALKLAVELTPDGHARKFHFLNNIGNAYLKRFNYLGKLSDIDSAIISLKQAIELTPDGHADKPRWLNNLGKHLGELNDIESAIVALKQAIKLTPDGHAEKPLQLNNLGRAHLSQLGHSQNTIDVEASLLSSGNPHVQLEAAEWWSKLCSTPALALQAYNRIFELIPQVVWLGQTVSHRYKELPAIGRIIGTAAATAISAGNLPLAVDIIWGQILQLRSPLNDLHHQHPKVAKELEMVARMLQNAGISTKGDSENIASGIKQGTMEEEAQKHRRTAARYEELVQQIRGLDGFTNFFKPKKLSELASAATHGPVITVNVDEYRCDALILCSSGLIIHAPLPMFSLEQAQQLHSKLVTSLHTKASRGNHDDFALILKALWLNVVQPILSKIEDVLHESTEDTIPHITWCPTGPLTLLPLHAAGIYGGPTERNINISDFVVSSYTTTLSALISSVPKFKEHQAPKIPTVLIVSQPNTPGLPPLPGTVEEAKVIQKYTLNTHTCHLNHDAATANAVMHEMGNYDFIHFACHGIQDMQDPLDTTGDENLPEEAVHLAAGMLAVGYPSVIATLWSIGDNEAPLIADKVYANLLGHHDNLGSKMTPAYALHEATKNLRKEVGETSFVKWVPFIHLGA
ncbi:TPR-like protein [Gymnopus androsaceus JB14]|uniref:TPR-like protein n=1 Tax=Gymnopus androsaceus JB14 TaxID=1447944 RepID=A0A6A4HAS4_9AGAR|nr:TPR-like protein [Gymnopus androsaceus JB14]